MWALSLYTCKGIELCLENIVDKKEKVQTVHKEESNAHIKLDYNDRISIKQKLETCIDPFDPDTHPSEVINIVSGRIGPTSVTVYNLVSIGKKQMKDFENSWSTGGFYKTINKLVITMSVTKKSIPIGELKLYNTNLIFSCIISLQATS